MSRWISETVLILGCIAIGYLLHHPRPAPVPAPVTQCWGLEQWHVDGDSVILLKFHKMPDTVEIQTKGETK